MPSISFGVMRGINTPVLFSLEIINPEHDTCQVEHNGVLKWQRPDGLGAERVRLAKVATLSRRGDEPRHFSFFVAFLFL